MISMVMSYYNRLRQFDFTLSTIAQSAYKNYEIVIVDDFSDQDHDPSILQKKYSQINIRIIRMKDVYDHKWYINPCIPYNVGFRASQGSAIIIQNPECCHVGDVLSHCAANVTDQVYLSYHCWSCTKDDLKLLHDNQPLDYQYKPKATWYNHQIHRPESFHFCTALTRQNLKMLNGFDERFAQGFSYDDTEFIQRVKNLGLKIDFVANPHVVHQPHPKSLKFNDAKIDNKALYFSLKETGLVSAPNQEIII
jgi:GT2 family glycosyltransferase